MVLPINRYDYIPVVCEAGEKRMASSNTCEKCPIGEYQPMRGQSSCMPCVSGNTTEAVGTDVMTKCVRK